VVPNRLTESIIREVLSLNGSGSSGEDLRQWEARVHIGVQRRKLSKGADKPTIETSSNPTAVAAAGAPIDLASEMAPVRIFRPTPAMAALLQYPTGHKHRQLFLSRYFDAAGRSSTTHVENAGRVAKRMRSTGVAVVTGSSSSSSSTPTPNAVFDLTEDSQKQI